MEAVCAFCKLHEGWVDTYLDNGEASLWQMGGQHNLDRVNSHVDWRQSGLLRDVGQMVGRLEDNDLTISQLCLLGLFVVHTKPETQRHRQQETMHEPGHSASQEQGLMPSLP